MKALFHYIFVFIGFTFLPLFSLHAQNLIPEVLASGGDYLKNNKASMSITFGEVSTETINSTNSELTQGFQQTNLIASSIIKTEASTNHIQVFPNPTNSDVFIHFDIQNCSHAIVCLSDLAGKIILEEKCEDIVSNKKISLINLANGSYFVTIETEGSQSLKETFLITKVD